MIKIAWVPPSTLESEVTAMIVNCSAPRHTATSTLVDKLKRMGLDPQISMDTISVFYNGPDVQLGGAIVELFAHEADHRIKTG